MTDHQFEIYDKIYIYSGISDYGQKMTYIELLDTLNNLQQEAIDCQCLVEKVLQKYVDLIMRKGVYMTPPRAGKFLDMQIRQSNLSLLKYIADELGVELK